MWHWICAITFVICVSMQYSVLLVPVGGAGIGGCGTGLVPVGGAGVGGCGTGFVQ